MGFAPTPRNLPHNTQIDNVNTMRQGKAPESSIGGYLVKVSLGLRLGQAVRRQRIRQERKPRKSRARRMANVATGQRKPVVVS